MVVLDMNNREIVQFTADGISPVTALCNDGTVWCILYDEQAKPFWYKYPDIPQIGEDDGCCRNTRMVL
jgi:hypothetical protein